MILVAAPYTTRRASDLVNRVPLRRPELVEVAVNALARRAPAMSVLQVPCDVVARQNRLGDLVDHRQGRSEEHTSELQSLRHLVCRVLLEKKNTPLNVQL